MAQWHLSWHRHSRAVMPMVGGEGRCWLPVLMGCLVPVLLSPIPTGCPEPGAWLSSAPGPHYCAVARLDHHVWRLRGGSGGECPIFGVGTKCKGRVALACAVLRGAGPACSGGAVVLRHPCGDQGSTGWRSGVRGHGSPHPLPTAPREGTDALPQAPECPDCPQLPEASPGEVGVQHCRDPRAPAGAAPCSRPSPQLPCAWASQVKLVNIRNDDIADGNPKLTLGLIWTIILHFQVSPRRRQRH